jgi:hypothetical protein
MLLVIDTVRRAVQPNHSRVVIIIRHGVLYTDHSSACGTDDGHSVAIIMAL